MIEKQILEILPGHIRKELEESKVEYKRLQEIRIRVGQVPILVLDGQELILESLASYLVEGKDIREVLEYVSQYSLFAYEQELKQGYITIEGGHRIGVVGKAIVEQGRIKNLKYISSLNIRVAHEQIGCAEPIISHLLEGNRLCHTLLVSPPRCGKTTILRDMIRIISSGNSSIRGRTVGVVDERSEIGGCYHGIPQNHLGPRTDILDGCPKVEGMMMLVRSMSPEVIAIDEIGMAEDFQALEYVIRCGCGILATVHGANLEEIRQKPLLSLMMEKQTFQRYVVIGNWPRVGHIDGVYDGNGNLLYQDIR